MEIIFLVFIRASPARRATKYFLLGLRSGEASLA